jgi:hypothetical protein
MVEGLRRCGIDLVRDVAAEIAEPMPWDGTDRRGSIRPE